MITFDQMPQTLEGIQHQLTTMQAQLTAMQNQQPHNEPPIDGAELRKRLSISRPTEISMRKRGKLPFLSVNGHYRYDWQAVVKKLSSTKKN